MQTDDDDNRPNELFTDEDVVGGDAPSGRANADLKELADEAARQLKLSGATVDFAGVDLEDGAAVLKCIVDALSGGKPQEEPRPYLMSAETPEGPSDYLLRLAGLPVPKRKKELSTAVETDVQRMIRLANSPFPAPRIEDRRA